MKKTLFSSVFLFISLVSFAQWEPDIRLTDTYDTSYLNYGKSHAIATSGDTVHIVWYEKIDDNWDIYYKRSTDGGNNWDWETRLTETQGYSKYPSIAVSGQNVYVTWSEIYQGNQEIWFMNSLNGGDDWSNPVSLTSELINSHGGVIAAEGSDVHIAWINTDEVYYQMVHTRHSTDAGLTWSEIGWLSPNGSTCYNVSIALTGDDVHAVWNDGRDGNFELYYVKSSDNGTTWGPETRLTNDPGSTMLPSIEASGSYINIAFMDNRTGYYNIYCKGSIDGGLNWGADTRVSQGDYLSYSSNLALANNVLHLVWLDLRSGAYDIFYSWSSDFGQTWSTEIQLNELSFYSDLPFVAVGGQAVHVIWYDYRDFNYEIYYKRNPTGGMVGVGEQLRAKGEGLYVYPNPAGDQLTVGQSPVSGPRSSVNLSIVYLYGRELKNIGEISSFPYQIDISGLPDGVYVLKVYSGKNHLQSLKFIKSSNR